jgi:hypothetical protein
MKLTDTCINTIYIHSLHTYIHRLTYIHRNANPNHAMILHRRCLLRYAVCMVQQHLHSLKATTRTMRKRVLLRGLYRGHEMSRYLVRGIDGVKIVSKRNIPNLNYLLPDVVLRIFTKFRQHFRFWNDVMCWLQLMTLISDYFTLKGSTYAFFIPE